MSRLVALAAGLALLGVAGAAAAQFNIQRPGTTSEITMYYDHGDDTHDGRQDHLCGTQTYAGHTGTDYARARGSAVQAASAGWVVRSVQGWPSNEAPNRVPAGCGCVTGESGCNYKIAPGGGYGNHVTLLHPGGLTTMYAHLNGPQPAWGSRIDCGGNVGSIGLTGCTSGAHLHFEVRHGVQTTYANICESFRQPYAAGNQTPGGASVDPESGSCNLSNVVRYGSCSDEGVDELETLCGCWSLDAMRFVSETLPDHTVLDLNTMPESVDKSWTLENAGSTVWEPGKYSLRFVGDSDPGTECLQGCEGGERLGGAEVIPIDVAVAPGAEVTVSVSLTVPTTPGEYRGSWRLYNEQEKKYFGDCLSFWIHVVAEVTAECWSNTLNGPVAAGDVVETRNQGACHGTTSNGCGYWWRCACLPPDCSQADWECMPAAAAPTPGATAHPLDCGGSGGSGGGTGSVGERPLLVAPDPPASESNVCWSLTLGEWVQPGSCVQVTYASSGKDECGWRQCKQGGYWEAVEDENLASCTSSRANLACSACTGDECPSECQAGDVPLAEATSACTAAVCDTEGYESCCAADGAWDEECVARAQTTRGFCRGVCYDSSAANTCAHNECTPGDKLDPSCSPCAKSVCETDAFCCESKWDVICATITAKRDPFCWCPG